MEKIKFGLFQAELICLLILLPSNSSARYPHRCEKGYYQWLDRGRYLSMDRCRYQWTRCYPSCQTQQYRYSYLEPYRRVVISRQPVVIERVVVLKPRKYNQEESELLRRIKDKKSEFLKKLKDADKEQRKQAIQNLSGFCLDPLVRAILAKVLLSDADPELRAEAAKSLGRVNNWKAIPALKKAKQDSDEQVRKEAEKAIKKVKQRYLKKLRQAEELFKQAEDRQGGAARKKRGSGKSTKKVHSQAQEATQKAVKEEKERVE